jgi:hypothetical protein
MNQYIAIPIDGVKQLIAHFLKVPMPRVQSDQMLQILRAGHPILLPSKSPEGEPDPDPSP